MKPKFGHRKSMRLQGFDYTTPGAYFLTINTLEQQHVFGEIKDGVMFPNVYGNIVLEEWEISKKLRSEGMRFDEFVLMPNHLHAIVWMTGVRPLQAEVSQSISTVRAHCNAPLHDSHAPLHDSHAPLHDSHAPLHDSHAPLHDSPTEHPQKAMQRLQAAQTEPKPNFSRKPWSVSSFVAGFKGAATRRIRASGFVHFAWQRNFYDEIVRCDEMLSDIQNYIQKNPINWTTAQK
jgi:putative transposase